MLTLILLVACFLHRCSYYYSEVLQFYSFLIHLLLLLLLFLITTLNFTTKPLSNAILVLFFFFLFFFVGLQLLAIKYNFPVHPTSIHIFSCLSFFSQSSWFLIYFGCEKLALLKLGTALCLPILNIIRSSTLFPWQPSTLSRVINSSLSE